ncbi:MAG: arsenite efflux MFS transporter ArsK [Hyphomicrobiales bacterium]|nr:arsenite efflux MFS transporter ArsK [Hyphomicrobiales bacterium]
MAHLPDTIAPAVAIWALGVTQIIGYGTLFYSFPVLAPAMSVELQLPQEWVFAALSAALFLGSLLAPVAGRWADRLGAARLMTAGSLAASLALAACALSPGRASFVGALVAMELASCFVLYGTAFATIVQIGAAGAQRSITHLTLIAGFASTLFWPLTSMLHAHLTWREVYLVFAATNLLVCLPIHAWLMGFARRRRSSLKDAPSGTVVQQRDAARPKGAFLIMLTGFAIEGFVLSAILLHMVPLLSALGFGTAGVMVSMLFGPSQVASRLVNMVFGGRLRQTHLAVIAASLLAGGLVVLTITSPAMPGVAVFVVLFGLGSGLASIVGGTLPLELFGHAGYGARVGWVTGARQFSSSFAPFAFAFMVAHWTTSGSLWVLATLGAAATATFVVIAFMHGQALREMPSVADPRTGLVSPRP